MRWTLWIYLCKTTWYCFCGCIKHFESPTLSRKESTGLEVHSRAGNSLIWFPSESLVFCQKMSEWAIHSKKWAIHSFTHFWWAICSRLLISSEQPERFTHDHSFPLSDLSESLTVAHLIWAKWENEQMINEQMSEFPALVHSMSN